MLKIFKNLFSKILIFLILGTILVLASFLSDYYSQRIKTAKAASKEFTSSTTISATDTTYDNYDITINGATVTIYGFHQFNSLKIKNNGVLTHRALLLSDINTAVPPTDPNYLLLSGKDKKVDIDVSGDVVLETGGKIDASGKGFPGYNGASIPEDCVNSCPRGYGPGGGMSEDIHDDVAGGAGAGYGGRGGPRYNYQGTGAGQIYGDENNPADYGSGGGGARHHEGSNDQTNGGAGGGLVRITANKVIISHANSGIYANGTDGQLSPDYWCYDGAGGGSGGSINITIREDSNFPSIVFDGGSGCQDRYNQNGVAGSFENSAGINTGLVPGKISARGGNTSICNSDYFPGGGGGGGRIAISRDMPSSPTCNLTANPIDISSGGISALSWTTTNSPTTASIDNGVGDVIPPSGGTKDVSPTNTTTYTLTVSNGAGAGSCQATVTVSTSRKVRVEVTWQELGQTKTIELKALLKDIK